MTDFLLSPLVAFIVYMLIVAAVSGLGRFFSAQGTPSLFKTATYAGGEEHDSAPAAPGYRPFFVVALFFAVLHLGVLMLGSSDLSPVAGVYLMGLVLALLALILG
jgi:hypothetical protein